MFLAILLLFTGLTLSAVAIYYSVFGLTAIFSAAVIPIIVMGSSLEVAKLVCASWLKANWTRVPLSMKAYMSAAVVVLMLITSMGIFGFLSKAHSDQSLVSGDVQAKIGIYDEKIKTARENIESDRKQLKQMDESVDQVMGRSQDEKGADKANAIRKSQQRDRSALAKDIETNQKLIATLNDEAAPIRAEVRKVEAEVGPIKYIAKFIYGDKGADENMLEKAVTWVIILIVIVFDPLAVIMLLASQMTFQWHKQENEPVSEEELINDFVEQAAIETMNEIEKQEEPIIVKSEQPSVLEPQAAPPAYLSQPFDHFKDLKPMPAPPQIYDEEIVKPKLQDDVLSAYDDERLVSAFDKLELTPGVPVPLNELPELQAVIKAGLESGQLEIVGNNKPLIKPLEGEEAANLLKEVGIFTEDGKLKPEYGGEEVQEEEVSTVELTPNVQPEIQTLGIDNTERPGDYVTPPKGDLIDTIKEFITPQPAAREAAPGRNRGKMYSAPQPVVAQQVEQIHADNAPELGKSSKSDFGTEFPINPEKGDRYLRVDYLPNRLFKFNGQKWIQIDKEQTDVYAYDTLYIKHLVDEIANGRVDIETLTELERQQIENYLQNNN